MPRFSSAFVVAAIAAAAVAPYVPTLKAQQPPGPQAPRPVPPGAPTFELLPGQPPPDDIGGPPLGRPDPGHGELERFGSVPAPEGIKAGEEGARRFKEVVDDMLTRKPSVTVPAGPEVRRLLAERYEAAVAAFREDWGDFNEGRLGREVMIDDMNRICDAAAEMHATAGEDVPLLEINFSFALEAEKLEESAMKIGRSTPSDRAKARYRRLDAEVRLARAKASTRLPAPSKATPNR